VLQNTLLQDTRSPEAHTTIAIKDLKHRGGVGKYWQKFGVRIHYYEPKKSCRCCLNQPIFKIFAALSQVMKKCFYLILGLVFFIIDMTQTFEKTITQVETENADLRTQVCRNDYES
jgi:hypothetical protein